MKPWLLPNIDPTGTTGNAIFDSTTGAIQSPALVGLGWPGPNNNNGLFSLCNGDCSAWHSADRSNNSRRILSRAAADFSPIQAPPACSSGFTLVPACRRRLRSDAHFVWHEFTHQQLIRQHRYHHIRPQQRHSRCRHGCGDRVPHSLVTSPGDSDSIDPATRRPPLQFVAGNQNPIASAVGKDVMVSDSLVTIPVINNPPPNHTDKPRHRDRIPASVPEPSTPWPCRCYRPREPTRSPRPSSTWPVAERRHRAADSRQWRVSRGGAADLAAVVGSQKGIRKAARRCRDRGASG